MKLKQYPKISVIIPAHNEEKNLRVLISSLKKLTYPRDKIEYILIEDSSTDNTGTQAGEFGMKVIPVKTLDYEKNKDIGMHKASGDYLFFPDADMEILSKNFFELLVSPMIENKKIAGAFTKEFALDKGKKVKNSLLRYISYDPLQRDPLYQFFSPSIESTIIEKLPKYYICKYLPGKIPPSGRVLYKRKVLEESEIWNDGSFIDLENLEILARRNQNLFAYVPSAKIRHYHAKSLRTLITKRLRNMEKDYLPNIKKKYYTWFELDNPFSLLKIIFWIIYANLFIPETLIGIFKSIIYKDIAFLWQPIVSIATTDAVVVGFLSKPTGRKLATQLISKFFGR